ncbi:Uncharacterised protein [Staphylococcus aureus]|nr:hypothetical protein M6KS0367p4_2593 [Staphylococcus aureus]CAC7203733.1 Uncharacterised protein [Staphylococcus aureus]
MRFLSVMALDILLIPPIMLFKPPIALLATFLPKSAAALPMSLPISLIQSYVFDSHFLKPLNTDLALDHAELEIASKRSWALEYISPVQPFKDLYELLNHFDVPFQTDFAFDHAVLEILSHFERDLLAISVSQPFALLYALLNHFDVPLQIDFECAQALSEASEYFCLV